MVEHSAVNRRVVGSNPTRGARMWGGIRLLSRIVVMEVRVLLAQHIKRKYLGMRCFLFLFVAVAPITRSTPGCRGSFGALFSVHSGIPEGSPLLYRDFFRSSASPGRSPYQGTRFTTRYRPRRLAVIKGYPSKAGAYAAEATVKGWKAGKMIGRLICGDNWLL